VIVSVALTHLPHLPNQPSAGKTTSAKLQCPETEKRGGAVGQPSSRSPLLGDPYVKFFCESSERCKKEETSKNEEHPQLLFGVIV